MGKRKTEADLKLDLKIEKRDQTIQLINSNKNGKVRMTKRMRKIIFNLRENY